MDLFGPPKMRMYCERLIDGKWTAIRNNGKIAFRDEKLDSFYSSCIEEIYNISIAWTECTADILGRDLKKLLSGTELRTLRLNDLKLFIDKCIEEMYGAITLEAIRNTHSNDSPSREEFDKALESFAELKIIEKDVLDILGFWPDYIDHPDIRIVWAEQN